MFDLAVLVHLEADTDKTPILTEVLSHDAVSTADSHESTKVAGSTFCGHGRVVKRRRYSN